MACNLRSFYNSIIILVRYLMFIRLYDTMYFFNITPR